MATASLVSAIVLIGTLAAIAQQASQSNQNAQSNQANQNNLGKLDDKTRSGTVRASQLIGANLQNSNGDSVGEINDLVLDQSGKVRYAAVTYGGFLGVGSKMFAVPFEAFKVRLDSDLSSSRTNNSGATATTTTTNRSGTDGTAGVNRSGTNSANNNNTDSSDYVLTLDVTKEQLDGAQGFDSDHWPDFADTKFTQDLDRRYNVSRNPSSSQIRQ